MSIRGITLDTGALIAIERRRQRGTQLLELGKRRLALLSVPMPVVAKWWRGRTDVRERILDVVNVEPLPLAASRGSRRCISSVRMRVLSASVLQNAPVARVECGEA